MTTNRTPVARPAVAQITERAIDLFVAMGKLRCTCPSPRPPTVGPCPGCERWYDLHDELTDELQCEPWQWPCVSRQSPKRAGSTCWNEEIAARMALLKAAAKAQRTSSEVSKADERDADVVEPVDAGEEPRI
jgi:hypothetical protein